MILCLTERLIIREYEDSDADSIVRIVNNEGIYRTTYREPPPGSAGTPLPNRCARAQKEHGDGVCVSYAYLAFALFFILSRR